MLESVAPRRVVVVTHTGEIGGAESALLRLLRALPQRDFTVRTVLLSSGPLEQQLAAAGVTTRVVDGGDLVRVTRQRAAGGGLLRRAWETVRVASRLRRAVLQEEPELLVANSLKAAVLISVVAPLLRTPWVWHLHDRLSADYLPGPVAVVMRLLARRGPRVLVANSFATAATIGSAGRGRVVVAYPGLDASAFQRPRRRSRSGPIGIIGRISETKGQRVFLRAAESIAAARPSARFVVIGAALFEDEDEEIALRKQCAASPIADAVRWAGWVDDPARELRGLRMLVHASPTPEPFGQVVIEALAARVPVIATDAGGVREILDPESTAVGVGDGVRRSLTGMLVRPGDAGALARGIEWVLDHPEETAEMRRRGRDDAASRFTIERTAEQVSRAWTLAMRRHAGDVDVPLSPGDSRV